jgi:ABC-type glycerol-3-phosphate transport system permease component
MPSESATTSAARLVDERAAARYTLQNRIARMMRIANRVFAYVLLVTFVFSMAMPLFWMVLCSLKPEGENLSYPPTIIPQTWTLEHYERLFSATLFPTWFRNSTLVSIGTTLTAIAVSGMGAYVFSRFRYRFFEAFSRLILFAYMVPRILLLIPIFKIVWSLKLSNSLYGLLLTNNAFLIPYGLWTLRSYFAGIPHEIEEAALIDGCTRWRAFVRVVIPQALPGIISTALFAFHVAWNEYLFSSVLLWSSDLQTLSAGVATLMGELAPDSWGLLMAAGVMITLPVIALFSFMQSFLIAGWGGGAVKG